MGHAVDDFDAGEANRGVTRDQDQGCLRKMVLAAVLGEGTNSYLGELRVGFLLDVPQ